MSCLSKDGDLPIVLVFLAVAISLAIRADQVGPRHGILARCHKSRPDLAIHALNDENVFIERYLVHFSFAFFDLEVVGPVRILKVPSTKNLVA